MTFCSHRISLNSSKPKVVVFTCQAPKVILSDSKWNKRRFHLQIPDVLVKNNIKMLVKFIEIPSWIFWFAVALNIAPVFWLNQCLTMYFSAIKSMFHPFFPMAESGNVWNPRVLRPQNLPLDQAYPWAPWRSRRRLPRTACHLCRGKGSIERLETLSEVMENSFQITLW